MSNRSFERLIVHHSTQASNRSFERLIVQSMIFINQPAGQTPSIVFSIDEPHDEVLEVHVGADQAIVAKVNDKTSHHTLTVRGGNSIHI